MSILIKGMEMPKNCAECPVNLYVCQRGYEYLLEHPELYDQRADDCPISYVPPHGRCIDADALIKGIKADAIWQHGAINEYDSGIRAGAGVIMQSVRNAPSIIPASEEGE